MSKLVFTPSKLCFSAGDEVMLKAFKKHLHTYKVTSLDGVAQPLLDCAYDLFHIVQTRLLAVASGSEAKSKSIKELEIKAGIREENNR